LERSKRKKGLGKKEGRGGENPKQVHPLKRKIAGTEKQVGVWLTLMVFVKERRKNHT